MNGPWESGAGSRITGVILAGGRARRMGGMDKGLLELGGRPLITYAIAALAPQVGDLLINANRNLDRYTGFGYPVVPDLDGSFAGPLAGMASAMQAAHTPLVLTVPCDSPLLPGDLAQRLLSTLEAERADLAVAHDGERLQPVFSLLHTRLLEDLTGYLDSGERKIDRWFAHHRVARVDFSDRPETFLNVNTPEELQALEQRLRQEP